MESTLESEIQALIRYRSVLSSSYTAVFDQLMHLVELNKVVANYTEIITAFDPITTSFLFDQQRQIKAL